MMEIERRLSSIQWKITRSFILATLVSAFVLTVFLFVVWAFVKANGLESTWVAEWLGISQENDYFIFRIGMIALISGVAALAGGAVIGFYSGRKIKRSLQSLSWAAEKLTRGELNYRISVNGEDEIAELAEQFNTMAMRVEAQVESLHRLIRENAELHQQARQHAVDEERQRLARELHDSISQQLFAIMMTMAGCARIIDKDPEKAKKQFSIIEDIAAQAQAEMRALLLHLRPVQLEGKHISEALRELLTELKAKHAIDYIWEIEDIDEVPVGFDEQIFRIAQEALSNALRHSQAPRIMLTLKQHNSGIIMRIMDNGKGFDLHSARSNSSMGLSNIKERTESMGGVLDLISAEGKGTTMEVRVPLLKMGESDDE